MEHTFRLSGQGEDRGFYCTKCGQRMNDADRVCTGRKKENAEDSRLLQDALVPAN